MSVSISGCKSNSCSDPTPNPHGTRPQQHKTSAKIEQSPDTRATQAATASPRGLRTGPRPFSRLSPVSAARRRSTAVPLIFRIFFLFYSFLSRPNAKHHQAASVLNPVRERKLPTFFSHFTPKSLAPAKSLSLGRHGRRGRSVSIFIPQNQHHHIKPLCFKIAPATPKRPPLDDLLP